MLNEKRETKGFNWMVVSIAAIVVVVLAALFGFENVSVFNQEEQAEADNSEATSETEEDQQEETEDRNAGEGYSEIQQFVSQMHDFYNETTGYGQIEQLDWEEQTNQAEQITQIIEENSDELTSDVLKEDLNQIASLAELVMKEPEASQVRELHRYFHDLDIAINDYQEYDQIWNVTETLNEN